MMLGHLQHLCPLGMPPGDWDERAACLSVHPSAPIPLSHPCCPAGAGIPVVLPQVLSWGPVPPQPGLNPMLQGELINAVL